MTKSSFNAHPPSTDPKTKELSDGNIYSASIRQRRQFPASSLPPRLAAPDHNDHFCSSTGFPSIFQRRPCVSHGSSHERCCQAFPSVPPPVDQHRPENDQDSTRGVRKSWGSSEGPSRRINVSWRKNREETRVLDPCRRSMLAGCWCGLLVTDAARSLPYQKRCRAWRCWILHRRIFASSASPLLKKRLLVDGSQTPMLLQR
jgi:hypothetical protein